MMSTNEEDRKCTTQRRIITLSETSDVKKCTKTSFSNLIHRCVVFVSIGLILAMSGSASIIIIHFSTQRLLNADKSNNNDESFQVPINESISKNNTSVSLRLGSNFTKRENNLKTDKNDSQFLITLQNQSYIMAQRNCFELIMSESPGNDGKSWFQVIDEARYWIEGVAIPAVGSIGLIGNLIVTSVLFCIIRKNSDKGSQRNFDITLMSLAIVDFILLLMYITDSCIQNHLNPIDNELSSEPLWYKMVYPKVWYPLKNLITTASHYMILAITVERYLVICHRKRKLLSPLRNISTVLIFSLLVSVPKFFEFTHSPENKRSREMKKNITIDDLNTNFSIDRINSSASRNESYTYRISHIGESSDFLIFNAYHEVLVIAFCLVTIIYCNYRICCNIKVSGSIKNRFIGNYWPSNAYKNVLPPSRNAYKTNPTNSNSNNAYLFEPKVKISNINIDQNMKNKYKHTTRDMEMTMVIRNSPLIGSSLPRSLSSNDISSYNLPEEFQTDLGFRQRYSSLSLFGRIDEKQMELLPISNRRNDYNIATTSKISNKINIQSLDATGTKKIGKYSGIGKSTTARDKENYKTQGTQTRESEVSKMKLKRNNTQKNEHDNMNNFCMAKTDNQAYRLNNQKEENILKPLINHDARCLKFGGTEQRCLSPQKLSLKTKTRYIRNKFSSSLTYQKQISTDSFKANRDKSFLILIGIVLIFLICNVPRLFVKVFIISRGGEGGDHFENCLKHNRLPVPGWIMIMGNINHLLIVLNSSVNFLVFCCAAKRFRKGVKKNLNCC